MNKIDTYSIKAVKLEPTQLPKDFSHEGSLGLLAQAVRVYEDNSHVGYRKTKTRSEVNRTKKKWYKQKGTGGARHGAKSAPIFVGGGIAHGPRPVKRKLSLSKQLVKKALPIAVSLKIKENKIIVVSGLSKIAKTKEAGILTGKLFKNENILLIVSPQNLPVKRYFKNLKNVKVLAFSKLNAFRLYKAQAVIFDSDIFTKKK